MADYNQALTVTEAIRRGQGLDGKGLYWIEEPTRHDDYAGCARVAETLATPVQIGENFAGAQAMAAGIEMSSHLFPGGQRAHLLAATPTCHWLEYVDWVTPILTEPLRIVDGMAQVPDRPGSGLSWDPDAVKRYRVA